MVKVINPLFSNSAHGRLGGLVYQTSQQGQIVKGYVPQHRKPTEAQIQQNYFFGIVSDAWRELTPEQQEVWNLQAQGTKLSGYNLYIKENIQHP